MDNNNTSSAKISETPHAPCHNKRSTSSSTMSGRVNSRLSYENGDSGYITITPVSADSTGYTSLLNTSCRLRSGCSNGSASLNRRRHHPRTRTTEPWQSQDRASRFRTKLNHRFDVSEAGGSPSSSFNNSKNETRDNVGKNSNPSKSQSLNSELEDLLRVHNGDEQQIITSVPKTPATSLQLLSPPPSPAVPSLSFVASEPIEEDVEMKLVIVPQSTPHLMSKNVGVSGLSPTTSRPSPNFGSVENHSKLSKLMITDLSMSDIRPKRLDFSQRPKYKGLRRSRAVPDQAGKSTVDFMSVLGEESDHRRIVSKILALLSTPDLCSVSTVSRAWRRICANDSRANTRRLSYIIMKQNVKENLKLIQAKAKAEGDVPASPKSRYARKGHLVEVQNLLPISASNIAPRSPPVSPSKVKFHSFVKAGRTLEPSEYLLPCPRCSFACHVNGEKNIASCSRQGCSMEFCICCSSRHTGPCKTALLATPTKRNKRLVVGSRQSKKNLRRL